MKSLSRCLTRVRAFPLRSNRAVRMRGLGAAEEMQGNIVQM